MQNHIIIPNGIIEQKIFLIRHRKVILGRDLAFLYGVETRALNQAVRRNIKRFPEDFMFQLSKEEMRIWKSQFVTSNRDNKGLRKRPLAFTEQGVAMLSSVLKSERAILVNIEIIRTFTKLRDLVATNKELREKIEQLEKAYDNKFRVIFGVIKRLLMGDESREDEIGFKS